MDRIEKLCKFEEELYRFRNNEKKLSDVIRPIILDKDIPSNDKIRSLLLYFHFLKDISEINLKKWMDHAELSEKDQNTITEFIPVRSKVAGAATKSDIWSPILKGMD